MDKSLKQSSIIEKLGPLLGLVLLVVVITVLNNNFIAPSNIFNLLRQVSINGLIAFGMTFVILTGGIDLSVGSILALSSALTALMMTNGIDPIIALLLGALIGIILGAFNGVLVTFGNMGLHLSRHLRL